MRAYDLSVVVDGFDLDSEFQNAALECLDYTAVVGSIGGVVTVDAEVEAESSAGACLKLIEDLRGLNVTVVRIDPDLVTVTDIADRLQVARETARLWTLGKRRVDSGFPVHYSHVGGSQVWSWADVYAWALHQDLSVEESAPVPFNEVEALNGALARRRSMPTGWLRPASVPPARLGFVSRLSRQPGSWARAREYAA